MHFGAQQLPNGRWIRVLTVVDHFTRERVTLLADNTLSGEKVSVALEKACCNAMRRSRSPGTTGRSSPVSRLTTGLTKTVCTWTSFGQAGGRDGYIESFNGKLRTSAWTLRFSSTWPMHCASCTFGGAITIIARTRRLTSATGGVAATCGSGYFPPDGHASVRVGTR